MKAIGLKVAHSFVFTILTFLIVKFSKIIPTVQVLFIISLGGCFSTFLTLKAMGIKISMKLSTGSWRLYLLRALLNVASMVTWIETVKYLGANEAMAFAYITPLWLLVSSVLILKDKFTWRILAAIFINSLGVILIVQPKIDHVAPLGIFLAIFTTMMWAAYDTICKKQSNTEHYLLQSF